MCIPDVRDPLLLGMGSPEKCDLSSLGISWARNQTNIFVCPSPAPTLTHAL